MATYLGRLTDLFPRRFVPSLVVRIFFYLLCTTNGIASKYYTELNPVNGPVFNQEPPGLIEFSHTSGTRIECKARGNPDPSITWLHSDGTPVNNVHGLRRVQDDGTLVFPPFRAEDYRQDVHAVIYRCVASNSVGTIVSRDVRVKAVVTQPYEVYVYDVYVIKGNTAVMKCHIPNFLIDYVSVTSWIRNGAFVIPTSKVEENGKYVILSGGELVISRVGSDDAGTSFRCQTTHRLTGESRNSLTAGKLFVTDPQGSVPPRITATIGSVTAKQGDKAIIPCVSQGHPVPVIEWYTSSSSGALRPVQPSARVIVKNSALIIWDLRSEDSTTYVCEASNIMGRERAETLLTVTTPLTVLVEPMSIAADVGGSITFRCITSGLPTPTITWLKDGSPLPQEDVRFRDTHALTISSIQPSHRGMYQCMATNDVNTVHGTAELKLGDTPARLVTRFAEQELSPGTFLSLSCLASGSPSPSVHWTIDGIFSSKAQTQAVGDGVVLSWLNITSVKTEDGGVYSCIASNRAGNDQHWSRIKIYGPLSVRSGTVVKAIADGMAALHCPVLGYPWIAIVWKKEGFVLPVNHRQNVHTNGTLVVEHVHRKIDAGKYTCIAEDPNGKTVRTEVEMQIKVPPKIIPFSFQDDLLREGSRARLQCVVSDGDLPIALKWLKDGKPISDIAGVTIRNLDDFSSILTIAIISPRHNGNYTCEVSNDAAIVSFTAELYVNVPPKILPFAFQDDQFFKGMRAHIICAVSQGDLPIHFEWLKDGQRMPPSLGVVTRNIDGHANSLSIESVSSVHSGNYTCIASNEATTVSHTAHLFVYVAPKISPFSFQEEQMHLGAFVRVSCVVYQGDLPITLMWMKDGRPVTPDLEITTKVIDEYSSILTIENIDTKHSGNYTCLAKNTAATATYTTHLTVNVPPKIVPFSFQAEHLFEGMLVRVSCVVSRGDLPLSITWLKDGHPIPPELSVSIRDFDEYSSVLSIDPLSIRHNGNYTCTARNHAASVSHTAQLLVNVPPRWVIEPQDATVTKGNPITIPCKADGFPEPKITWMKVSGNIPTGKKSPVIPDSNTILYPNGSLHIISVSIEHQGYYFCIASNGVNQGGLGKAVQINVLAPPNIITDDGVVTAKKDENINLYCEVMGNFPIEITWLINNEPINFDKNSRFKVVNQENKEKTLVRSELFLKQVARKDSTKYLCVAKNIHGDDEMEQQLIVFEPPETPTDLKVTRTGNRTAQLAWKPPFDGNSKILHYIIQFKKADAKWEGPIQEISVTGAETSATIDQLLPATRYDIRIRAENEVGVGEPSNVISMITEEEAPSGAPQYVEVEPTDAYSLRVSWKPPRRNQWNGGIRGYHIGYRIHESSESYTFSTLEVPEDYTDDLIYQLTDLKMYTQYSVVVQAYNKGGNGPLSEEMIVLTSEDVPTQPPKDVRCSSLSARSIYIIWEPPPSHSVNGILRGYKVLFKPADLISDLVAQSKISQVPKMTLQELEVNTNYSVQVLAFTKMGDGIKSDPIFCKTHEDVPGAPDDIKVLPSSLDSVLVSWKPPNKRNGVVTKYNVYVRALDDDGQEIQYSKDFDSSSRTSLSDIQTTEVESLYYEVTGLKKNRRYEFWVTASSIIGEGPGSRSITQMPAGPSVAAKLASFNDVIKTPWKRDVIMPCKIVGSPSPDRKWLMGGSPLKEDDRVVVRFDGALMINQIQVKDGGNYTCLVLNDYGRDEVTYCVVVQVPPGSPTLEVVSKTLTSIQLQWKKPEDGGDPIRGFILHFKRDRSKWERKELPGDIAAFTLDSLACGATYQLYLEALNNVGTGPPCDIITVATKDEDVIVPSKDDIIREGSTFITVHLDTWPSTGCPILHFTAEYRKQTEKEWQVAGKHIKPTQKKLVLPGLSPASWYFLRIVTHTNGGASATEYAFSTHTASGATVGPEVIRKEEERIFFLQLEPKVFVPIIAIIMVLIVIFVLLSLFCKKNRSSSTTKHRGLKECSRASTPRNSRSLHTPVDSFVHIQKRGERVTGPYPSLHGGTLDEPVPYASSQVPGCFPQGMPYPNQGSEGGTPRPGTGESYWKNKKNVMDLPVRPTSDVFSHGPITQQQQQWMSVHHTSSLPRRHHGYAAVSGPSGSDPSVMSSSGYFAGGIGNQETAFGSLNQMDKASSSSAVCLLPGNSSRKGSMDAEKQKSKHFHETSNK